MKAMLMAIFSAGALLVAGCPCVECAPCEYGGPGFCGGTASSCFSCGECPTLCPGYCRVDAGEFGLETRQALPCPGLCANASGTAAGPCDGG